MNTPQYNVLSNHSWKVVYVSSRSEKKVSERLRETGIENYVPIKREKRKWSDRMKWVELPLINGYVFVRPSSTQRDSVLQHPGVISYVRYNGSDAVIRESEIAALRSIEQKGYFVELLPKQELASGQKVLIQHGPFVGLQGYVHSKLNEQMYTIDIEGIGYALKVRVPDEIIQKLS